MEKMIKEFEGSIRTQLRSLGVVLHDDAGNRIRPSGGEENRIINIIARNIAQLVALKLDCQSPVAGSMGEEEIRLRDLDGK